MRAVRKIQIWREPALECGCYMLARDISFGPFAHARWTIVGVLFSLPLPPLCSASLSIPAPCPPPMLPAAQPRESVSRARIERVPLPAADFRMLEISIAGRDSRTQSLSGGSFPFCGSKTDCLPSSVDKGTKSRPAICMNGEITRKLLPI